MLFWLAMVLPILSDDSLIAGLTKFSPFQAFISRSPFFFVTTCKICAKLGETRTRRHTSVLLFKPHSSLHQICPFYHYHEILKLRLNVPANSCHSGVHRICRITITTSSLLSGPHIEVGLKIETMKLRVWADDRG